MERSVAQNQNRTVRPQGSQCGISSVQGCDLPIALMQAPDWLVPSTCGGENLGAGLVRLLLVDEVEEVLHNSLQLLQADWPVVVYVEYSKDKNFFYSLTCRIFGTHSVLFRQTRFFLISSSKTDYRYLLKVIRTRPLIQMNLLWVWKGGLKCTLLAWKIFFAKYKYFIIYRQKTDFLRMSSVTVTLDIRKNTQNELFCQTTNSDELALSMKRWLEVHFLSLKNNFCQI